MYLLDTDVLSALMRPDPPEHLLSRFSKYRKSELFTSSINRGELRYGISRARKEERYRLRMERLWNHVNVLSFDVRAADIYADLRCELAGKGMRLADADLMIAAVCLANGLTLATGNERHLRRMDELAFENWLREP